MTLDHTAADLPNNDKRHEGFMVGFEEVSS